jgi:hypothetical protein
MYRQAMANLLLKLLRSLLRDNPQHQSLTSLLMGDGTGSALVDSRHGRYRRLDFCKTHPHSSDLKEGGFAAMDPNVSVLVQVTEIAGPEPAISEDAATLFPIIEIAIADGRTFYEDLTNLAGRKIYFILVNDTNG